MSVRLLLTSAGIKNTSIQDALVELLGKPITEASALCIPTAMYGHPWVGPGEKAWQFISGQEPNPSPTATIHPLQTKRRDLLDGLLHEYEAAP